MNLKGMKGNQLYSAVVAADITRGFKSRYLIESYTTSNSKVNNTDDL